MIPLPAATLATRRRRPLLPGSRRRSDRGDRPGGSASLFSPAPWARLGPAQIVLLGAATTVGPLTIDVYLPAFPEIAAEFGTSESAVQLSLTAVLVGIAVGQVVVGPLSDRFGRRAPLLVGFAAYVVVSLGIALAPSLETLLAARFVQGLVASTGMVVARAVLRDHVSGPALGRTLAGLLLVLGVVPILAPGLGSALSVLVGWRGIFVVLAFLGALLLVLLATRLPESLPASERRSVSATGLARTYGALLVDRTFVTPALVSGFGFGVVFAWISAGPFLLQGRYGLSELEFGLLFAVPAVSVTLGTQLAPRLEPRVGALGLLRLAPVIGIVASALITVLAVVDALPLPALLSLVVVIGLACGVILPMGATVALSGQPPHRAGLASGLLGVVQFVCAGLTPPLVGLLGTADASGMGVVATLASVGALVAGLLSEESRPSVPT